MGNCCCVCKLPRTGKASRCTPCDTEYKRAWRAAGHERDDRKNHRTGHGDQTCACRAYKFNHRLFGGRCSLLRWVKAFFEPTRAECRDCDNMKEFECEVVNGTEEAWHCPGLRDHVRFDGIVLYGRAAEQRDRSERR